MTTRPKKIRWLGVVERHGDALSTLQQPGDCLLVLRGRPRNLVLCCPDGCDEVQTVNLDPESGPAWRLFQRNGLQTLYPSVWLKSGCRSHFIIWRDRLLWCGPTEDAEEVALAEALVSAVDAALPSDREIHFAKIAESLGDLPWEVLWACRRLVRGGRAEEPRQFHFCRGVRRKNPGQSPPRSRREFIA